MWADEISDHDGELSRSRLCPALLCLFRCHFIGRQVRRAQSPAVWFTPGRRASSSASVASGSCLFLSPVHGRQPMGRAGVEGLTLQTGTGTALGRATRTLLQAGDDPPFPSDCSIGRNCFLQNYRHTPLFHRHAPRRFLGKPAETVAVNLSPPALVKSKAP